MKQQLALFLILCTLSINVFGKITLPSIFSNNMVLQQNSEVAFWGWAEPGETIKIVVSWNVQDTITVKANNYSAWKTTIKTPPAGETQTIEFLGSSHIKLENVLLGEVWICSGQSNMDWRANLGIDNKDEEIANANYPKIRIFSIPRIGADTPQRNTSANWTECTPETMRSTSAVGYFFAREVRKKLNVPVGIIFSAWGGTPVETWIKESLVENNAEYDNNKYQGRPDHNWPSKPGATYNGMISPIIPFGIAGVLWYQGESNCGTYPVYASLKKTLIENWRNDFKKDFPFYFVQIAPYDYGKTINSAYLREQQELTMKLVQNTGMIVISDLVTDIKEIHPRNKLDVGIRLAAYALSDTYHKNIGAYKSPMYNSITIEKNKIRVSFNNILTGLKSSEKNSTKFLIAGEDQKFVQATAKIEGNTVTVSSKLVKKPVAVRYCFDNTSLPDVFSNEGLPMAPFRTDTW